MMNLLVFLSIPSVLPFLYPPYITFVALEQMTSSREAKPDRSSSAQEYGALVSTSRSRGETSFSFCRAAVWSRSWRKVPVHHGQHGGLTSSEWPQKVASRLFTGYADARLRAVGANDSIRMQLRPSALMSASRIVTMHVMPFCDPTWCHLSHA
ncbi:hypothetical protein J3E68DRAFT_119249 [Trichoderma sp. SZMC 28012]